MNKHKLWNVSFDSKAEIINDDGGDGEDLVPTQ
jgi:hypothetical protein